MSVAGLPRTLDLPGGVAMQVPPRPRDWASVPEAGKNGSALVLTGRRSAMAAVMMNDRMFVFMIW